MGPLRVLSPSSLAEAGKDAPQNRDSTPSLGL